MAFMMEKILNNAQKLSNRLKEHDGSTDNLVELMTNLNKKIDSMKTFQDNLPDLTEMALRKPRCTIKLGLSQENSQIRELEQENRELKQSLEEHELALELIMSKYRQQVMKLIKSNQVKKSILYEETAQSQELQDKTEKINEMAKTMWKAIGEDNQSTYESQQLLTQLRLENRGIKELLSIACDSGNQLKAFNQSTQTDVVAPSPRHGGQSAGARSESPRISSDVVSRRVRADAPDYETSDHVNGALLVPGYAPSPKESMNPADLSSLGLNSAERSEDVRTFGEADRLSFSEVHPAQSPLSVSMHGNGPAQVPLSAGVILPDIVADLNCSADQRENEELRTLDSKSAVVENLVTENQTMNHPENFLHSQMDGNPSSAIDDAIAVKGNHEVSKSDHALHASPATNAAGAEPETPPKQQTSSTARVNDAVIHQKGVTGNKNLVAGSSGVRATPKSSVSPAHGATPKNVSTSAVGSASSKLKHGNPGPGSANAKTPVGKSSAMNDNSSAATGGRHSPAVSPSIHSGKTVTTGHAARATPIRIKATVKHPSVFSVVGAVSTCSSPSDASSSSTVGAVTSSAVLDSNGNSSHSTTSNEISNMNNASADTAVEGQ